MVYFDNAATSYPKPKIVYDTIMEAMVEYGANPGRSGHKKALEASRGIFDTRTQISKLFNIKNPMNVIFTFNCTESLNTAIKGVLKPGDHVITTSMEHNSVLRPITFLSKLGIKSTIVQGDSKGRINPKDIEASIKPETKMIVTTHISNLTGSIMDIETIGKIAKNHGIIYLVDGAQSAGVYNIDVEKMNIDLLAFPGHKGLLGPQGTGGLYIRDGIELDEIFQGGTGSISHSLEQPDVIPDKFESGTPNAPGIIGLGSGIKYIFEKGIDNIRKKEEELTRYFIEESQKIDGVILYGPLDIGYHAPVVALNIKDADSSEISYILDSKYDIAVRPGLHCAPLAHKTIGTFEQGVVRFSFGYENTHEEIEFAIKALKEIAKEV
ncbi:cysteine desulfurase family protein [Tissierella praeacuta DSM 18095]|uniref:cysteine desulfurase n=1 Tax=Tissierella praeacuta DSM 18095 TaxID=1123404 RepID=A0A1M4YZC3_9FIRM|nr:aminotransferase class V-fold PLP-dependent enzyme [Tissierella praeacuta]TCU66231.1 cysteine desulfurase family protein [Tissierella praeacuta]SHF10917.1 cysteine desulfurase family protein [Tissierella praeacuta DSM 18095]SUP04919.1 Probable cysteine desulfurase [Tissierella praeacuta]